MVVLIPSHIWVTSHYIKRECRQSDDEFGDKKINQQSWSNIRVHGGTNILWHADPLLGSEHETGERTAVVARQESCFLHGPCQDVISRATGAIIFF